MKAHIGVDVETGLVDSLAGTSANVHDITQAESLLHGSKTDVFADAGYRGNAGARTLSAAEQFRVMAFAQLTWRESLRDIEASLGANPSKLYGMGFRAAVRRTSLADANELRDWKIWADLAAVLFR